MPFYLSSDEQFLTRGLVNFCILVGAGGREGVQPPAVQAGGGEHKARLFKKRAKGIRKAGEQIIIIQTRRTWFEGVSQRN